MLWGEEITGHLKATARPFAPFLAAMRPHQWLKNLLVFLPILTAHKVDGSAISSSFMAFLSFNFTASSAYVLNDLLDLEADRNHPRKRWRPFASGRISAKTGAWMSIGLLLTGISTSVFASQSFLFIVIAYFLVTSAYSLYFKRHIVIDICVLAGLYTARIVGGAAASDTTLSVWLLAFSMFIFLCLASVKRQSELIDTLARGDQKAGGRGYMVEDLPIVSMVSVGAGYVGVLVLALYVNSPEIVSLYGLPEALWGVCAVLLYWITRTVMISHRGNMHDDPVVFAAKDPISHLCLVIIVAFVLMGALG